MYITFTARALCEMLTYGKRMRGGVKAKLFFFWGGEGSISILNCVADTSSLYDFFLLYMMSLLRGFIILKYFFLAITRYTSGFAYYIQIVNSHLPDEGRGFNTYPGGLICSKIFNFVFMH